jgi:predicted RNase H-like HicB family nuclease
MARIKEAIALHLEELGDDAEPLEFVAIERVSIPA